MIQRDAVVDRQTQAGTRAGQHQRHTHRRVTSAHQRRPTTLQNGKQFHMPTRAATGNPPTRALHVHQARTARMHHSTTHTTKLAPKDKQSTTSVEAKAGVALEGTQSGSRGAGPPPRRPQTHPDTTAPESKAANRFADPQGGAVGKGTQ